MMFKVDEHLVRLARRDIVLSIHDDNPIKRAEDIMARMRGGVTEIEVIEAVNVAAKGLAEEVGLHNFLRPDMFAHLDREMIGHAKRSLEAYENRDDPLADARRGLRILYGQTDESRLELILEIAKRENEFQKRVDEYYEGLEEERRDELLLIDHKDD